MHSEIEVITPIILDGRPLRAVGFLGMTEHRVRVPDPDDMPFLRAPDNHSWERKERHTVLTAVREGETYQNTGEMLRCVSLRGEVVKELDHTRVINEQLELLPISLQQYTLVTGRRAEFPNQDYLQVLEYTIRGVGGMSRTPRKREWLWSWGRSWHNWHLVLVR